MMIALKDSLKPFPKEKSNGFLKTSNGSARSKTSNANGLANNAHISSTVGSNDTSKQFQKRTMIQYITLAAIGLAVFHQRVIPSSAATRAAAIGLLFPGAGFIACANIVGAVAFIFTWICFPAALFAWFGAGGFLFPILVWTLSAVGAYFAAGDSIFEYSDRTAIALVGALVFFFRHQSANERVAAEVKREKRNKYLPKVLQDIKSTSTPAPPAADRELTLEELRGVQYALDQARLGHDDWTNHTYIDQFQTSSLRYQLYELLYALGAYQGIYSPNFHGYLSDALQNVIAKSLTRRVNGFWKWESLWGKFTTNYDPVVRDNIMVTGFFQQGLMLYIANTGDMRYTKPGSLKFHITDTISYDHDVHSVGKAMVDQWTTNDYCLFPCEPNWTYTPCNFQGMTGQVIYDRVFGTTYAEDIKPRFVESLLSNFADKSGSIIPIRSSMTGFTIPGLTGALIDLTNGILTRGYLPDLAERSWALFKEENLHYDESTGELSFTGLTGADNLDAGNYETGEHAIFPHVAQVAAEFGDEKIRLAALKWIDKNVGTETTATGALRTKRGSFLYVMARLRATLLRKNDWVNLIREGPSKVTLGGPILSDVPYPGVLVAKARSHTGKDLELVLYPSAASGSFELGITRLKPGQKYKAADKEVTANQLGEVRVSVLVDGRTPVVLSPL